MMARGNINLPWEGSRSSSMIRHRTGHGMTVIWLMLLSFLANNVLCGEGMRNSGPSNFKGVGGTGAMPSSCEHGRFGPNCEFECHGGEGGFCTDEGIVCFLGMFPLDNLQRKVENFLSAMIFCILSQ
jgi:hypothetical protein